MKFRKAYLWVVPVVALFVYLIYPYNNSLGVPMAKIYSEEEKFRKDSSRVGVLLVNTGSPASLTRSSVREFIGDMLSDPYVMGMSEWFRTTLARKIIAPFRASSSLKRYEQIWGDSEFSPLLNNSLELERLVEESLELPVSLAMRYGNPSMEQAIGRLESKSPALEEIVVLPLFPQYAESSYLTAVEEVKNSLASLGKNFRIKIVEPYYNHSAYITSLSEQIKPYLDDSYDMLVYSFHSLPLSHIEKGTVAGTAFDYKYQCEQTARLTSEELGVSADKYMVAYASAIGRKWQEPFIEDVAKQFPSDGVKRIVVVSPGFIVDNLESLYDINVMMREEFLRSGGDSFTFVHCINSRFYRAATTLVSEKINMEF